jgi:DNA-binding MarR family transcriptional regulator
VPRKASGNAEAVTELADRLHSTSIHLLRRVRRDDSAVGLSAARLSALSVIVYGGPIRISALARAEQVRTPTITPLVAALERDGLIVREPDASDGRAALLRATPRGERLMAEGRARRVALLAAELRQLTAAERTRLADGVAILERLFKAPAMHRPKG